LNPTHISIIALSLAPHSGSGNTLPRHIVTLPFFHCFISYCVIGHVFRRVCPLIELHSAQVPVIICSEICTIFPNNPGIFIVRAQPSCALQCNITCFTPPVALVCVHVCDNTLLFTCRVLQLFLSVSFSPQYFFPYDDLYTWGRPIGTGYMPQWHV
jgi:hypothetical protein